MIPGPRGFLRFVAALATMVALSACTAEDRDQQLEQVDTIEIPVADTTTRTNFNIDNPTLEIPVTFPVSDGDLLTLVWSDEFDGAQLDPQTWFFESGDGSNFVGDGGINGLPSGWGNNELQWYLPDNAQLENGVLKITARREAVGDFGYTSARITTRDRFAFKYGRIEASIKLPSGQGLWPAFWMLSQDSPYGSWAATGEIDILEAVNLDGQPGPGGLGGGNDIFGTIHFGGEFPANQSSTVAYTPSEDVTGGFNTYALEWDEFEIRWYFNGILYGVQNSWSSAAGPYPAPFDQPFHVLLNLAVGGNLPGPPNGSTPFPATMEVDWIRVYSGEEAAGEPAAPGIIPDDVIYASDPNETVDLVFGVDYTGFEPFGSGSIFNNNVTFDSSFSPVFGVTTGNGYGAQVGQFAIVGFADGFAAGYQSLVFKAKNLNNNLVRLRLLPDGSYLDINLASSAYSTSLGDGWYQVVVPIADLGGAATANTLLFETDNTAAAPFTFLLTDFGFSATAGGGGGGAAIVPENVVYASDPGVTEDLAPAGVDNFGSGAVFDFMFAGDPDFNPVIRVASGEGYGAGVHVGFVAFTGYPAGFAAGYGNFVFKVKGDAGNLGAFEVKFIGNGDTSRVYNLATYGGVADLGNGWLQVSIPMSDFAATVAGNDGFLLGPLGGQAAPFTFLLTDIGFTSTAGGGGGGGSGGGAGDLAVNGGFETGDLSGWALFPASAAPGEQTVVTTNPRSGTYAGRLNNTTPGTASIIKQANLAPVAIGQTATVSFSARGSFGTGGVAFAEFFTELAGEGTSSARILGGAPLPLNPDPNVWADFEFVIPITADVSGGITLQLTATTGGAGSFADVYYDDVSIVIN